MTVTETVTESVTETETETVTETVAETETVTVTVSERRIDPSVTATVTVIAQTVTALIVTEARRTRTGTVTAGATGMDTVTAQPPQHPRMHRLLPLYDAYIHARMHVFAQTHTIIHTGGSDHGHSSNRCLDQR